MTSMPLFTLADDCRRGGYAWLTGAELHHLRDVLRLRPGASLMLQDSAGRRHIGTLSRFEHDAAVVEIRSISDPLHSGRLVLAMALIREPRMDLVMEKSVELGVSEIQPLLCERSLSRMPGHERIARWRRLAAAAAKQSLTPRRVVVNEPLTFQDFLRDAPRAMLSVLCQAEGIPIAQALRAATPAGVLIAVGPEGDFTAAELAAAREAGFQATRLNGNRLRSETAALAALSIAAAEMEELRKEG